MDKLSKITSQIYADIKNVYALPLYTILLAIYPVLFIYAHNIHELTINVLIVPLLVAVVVISAAMLVLNLLLKNWHKTAAILFLCLLAFYFYQPLVLQLPHHLFSLGSLEVTRGKFLLPLTMAALLIGVGCVLFKGKSWIGKLSQPLNLLMTFLVGVSLFQIITTEASRATTGHQSQHIEVQGMGQDISFKPDVYYIVFDRYAGQRTLSEYFDFDNGPFLGQLKNRGFYIADNSYANYPSTELSISSTLSMDYHQSNSEVGSPQDLTQVVFPKVQQAQAFRYLKDQGYKYFQVSSHYNVTQFSDISNRTYIPRADSKWHLDEFTIQFLETTMVNVLSKNILHSVVNMDRFQSFINAHQYQQQVMPKIIKSDGPKAVFTHVLLPHDPYVVNKDCQVLPESRFKNNTDLPAYLDQLQCANKLALEWVDLILQETNGQAIIVIQGDEGPYPLVNKMPQQKEFANASVEAIKERTRILNAFYFPDKNYQNLHNSITSVNTFRVILNQYFGATIETLPDKVYVFPDQKNYFNFIDVTDRLDLYQE